MAEDDEAVHEGGCLCGDVRYAVRGRPFRTSVCHCAYCQRRTGSGFAILPFFPRGQVRLTQGRLSFWRHVSDASGRWLDHGFCPRCGTGVTLEVEAAPERIGLAGGSFDDPAWFTVDRHIWTRSRLPWMALPEGVDRLDTA
jgi:hypothetical protein